MFITLHNSSRVKVDIVGGIFRLYQAAPLSDEEVEQLYTELIDSSGIFEVKWPMLYELEFSKGEDEIFVELGELYQEAIDFLVSIDTKSVVVYTYFGDWRYSRMPQNRRGWGLATTYDIMPSTNQS